MTAYQPALTNARQMRMMNNGNAQWGDVLLTSPFELSCIRKKLPMAGAYGMMLKRGGFSDE